MKYTAVFNISMQPTERARKGKWGWYTPPKTKQNRKFLQYKYRQFLNDNNLPMIPDKVKIKLSFRIWTERKFNKLAGDKDNYEKQILDAGNKILWHDDYQITKSGECEIIHGQKINKLELTVETEDNFLC